MNATLDKPMKKLDDLSSKFKADIDARAEALADDPSYLQKNFVMLHGTNCAWDKTTNSMIKCEHMKLSFPMAFGIWKSNPGREIIPVSDLVFAPAGAKNGQINMFTGIKLKPEKGDIEGWRFHLRNVICGGEQDVFEWVLKWLAYPLQNLGAKMATSVVVHGDEGAGKNLIFNPVQEIYGEWATQISQSQVESDFNAWISCKLFIIANEVLSKRERKHIKGKLKAWITEPTIQVRQLFMPVREEVNCANFIFLSNEDSPIDTDESDRRYLVLKTRNDLISEPASYYKELAKSIDVAAIYYHLLHEVDCTGFNPHEKPLMTQAKQDLLRSNMPSHSMFISDWLEGKTVFPVQTVGATQLYWAYQCWCAENGERFPSTSTAFGRALAAKKNITKGYPSIRFSSKKLTAYFIDTPAASTIDQETITAFELLVEEQKRKYHL